MLLNEFQGRASAVIEAAPADVFATITAIERLPEWNGRIAKVIEAKHEPLAEGVEWVVQMSVPPAKWPSRARVLRYDPARLLFEHVSQSDDGNPSDVLWRWTVAADPGGSKVTVAWEAHVRTFWRRFLFAKLRRKQLPNEVAASLDSLAYHLAPSEAPR
jgi:uncharacterized protein YndB with AHSA1/START domain